MTKAEERKILEQIVDLIQSTPMDSYIRSAFSGVPEYAVRNIDDDAAYNPVEERNMWEDRYHEKVAELRKKEEECGQRLLKLEHENQVLQTHLDKAEDQIIVLKRDCENWEQNSHEAGDLYCELEKECAEKDMEIMRLKAELYDYMRKEREQ